MVIEEYCKASLILEDGSSYPGYSFGKPVFCTGEVVFNTGMVGYPECLTDPSYCGQILVLTYPLIGNYGVPLENPGSVLESGFESERIQVAGVICSSYSDEDTHKDSGLPFSQWLKNHDIPAIHGVDTRALTKRLREHGTLPGKIIIGGDDPGGTFDDPNALDLVSRVTSKNARRYSPASNPIGKTVVLVDCGVKFGIIRSLLGRGVEVITVPYDFDFLSLDDKFHGIVISNGPGNPEHNTLTIRTVARAMKQKIPVFGICLGNQILALAAGGKTYKMKYGHRSANQPVKDLTGDRTFITAQNHGYAVVSKSLPRGYHAWFENANDRTNEGIIHSRYPFSSVQFHPEASPGPMESGVLFDQFIDILK